MNPEMIRLARLSRGQSQAQLASLIGVPSSEVSRFESGIRTVTDSLMPRIVDTLGYPISFFTRHPRLEGPGTDVTFHRKRKSVSNTKLNQIYALADIRRLEVEKLLEFGPQEVTVPDYPVDLFDDDPVKIARSVRAAMRVPPGPIFNVTKTLEQVGSVVVAHDFGTRQVDGFSRRPLMGPPFFHMNVGLPPDRWRWTLAHELGHVVMHPDPLVSPKIVEQQADQFAGEFLAPAAELQPMLFNLSFQRLAGLKLEWKISMQALVMRAYQLGTITGRQRVSMFSRLSKAGYRVREPSTLDPPLEPPERLFQLAKLYMTRLGYSRSELMDLLTIGDLDFQAYYHDPRDVFPGLDSDDEWSVSGVG